MTTTTQPETSARSRRAAKERGTDAPLRGRTEPRLFTPPLRDLSREANADGPVTTLGWDVIDFAEEDLGLTLHPYQAWLYVHALELLENGEFRYNTIVILIARQNGKTTWWRILTLYALYVLGLPLVMSTAQDLDTAEETWQEVVDFVLEEDEDEGYVRPDLAKLAAKPILVNGKKTFRLKSGERYKAKAASRRAGRGLTGDLIGLDEAREQQTWASWSAITHTTMARARSLIVMTSNAGDITSVVLSHFRRLAHAELDDPDGLLAREGEVDLSDVEDEDLAEGLGLFEWSAPPGRPRTDREGWAMANPSLNYPNGVPERKIRTALAEPEWEFRTEVLCQWPDGALTGPFPAGSWEGGWDEKSQVDGDDVTICIESSIDRSMTYIALAGMRQDGKLHAEIIERRAGTDWVLDWFNEKEARKEYRLLMRPKSPAATLIDDLREDGIYVEEWHGDGSIECGDLYDAVKDRTLKHLSDPALDLAAASAQQRITQSGGSVWDHRNSLVDVAPLWAVTGCVGAVIALDGAPMPAIY